MPLLPFLTNTSLLCLNIPRTSYTQLWSTPSIIYSLQTVIVVLRKESTCKAQSTQWPSHELHGLITGNLHASHIVPTAFNHASEQWWLVRRRIMHQNGWLLRCWNAPSIADDVSSRLYFFGLTVIRRCAIVVVLHSILLSARDYWLPALLPFCFLCV